MAQSGIDLATLAAILGHNSLPIVQKYVHPTAEHKREAMAGHEESLKASQEQGTNWGSKILVHLLSTADP
jgi:hypothetical protein